MAENKYPQEMIDLVREDLGIPKKYDIVSLVEEVFPDCDVKVLSADDNDYNRAKGFLSHYQEFEALGLSVKDCDLKKYIAGKDSDLSEASVKECYKTGLYLLLPDINPSNYIYADYFDLSSSIFNSIVDENVNKFIDAFTELDNSKMKETLKDLSSVTNMYEYLEDRWLSNTIVPYIENYMLSNTELNYEPKQVTFRNKDLEEKLDNEFASLSNTFNSVVKDVCQKDKIFDMLKKGDKEALLLHINLKSPEQEKALTNFRNLVKTIDKVLNSYIIKDNKELENTRNTLLKRYGLKSKVNTNSKDMENTL